eukprot:403359473
MTQQKSSPFKHSNTKHIHMIPICFQRAEEFMRQSLQSDRTHSPSQRGNLDNNMILHQSIQKSMKINRQMFSSTQQKMINEMNQSQYSQQSRSNNIKNNNEAQAALDEYDHLTGDSNMLQVSPSSHNNYYQHVLDSKFYNSNVNNQSLSKQSPRLLNQISLTTVKSLDKYENQQSSKYIAFHAKQFNQQKQKLIKQRQIKQHQNHVKNQTNKLLLNRTQVEPSLIQLNSSGPIDNFDRPKLLYFKPTVKQQQVQSQIMGNEDISHIYNNERIDSPKFENPNLKENLEGQNFGQHIQDQQPNQSLNEHEIRLIYRRSMKVKPHENQLQQIKNSNNLNVSQDFKLTKYLSPMKQHFRIAHRDNTEHKHQQKHIKNSFFNVNESKEQIQDPLQNELQANKSKRLLQLDLTQKSNDNNENNKNHKLAVFKQMLNNALEMFTPQNQVRRNEVTFNLKGHEGGSFNSRSKMNQGLSQNINIVENLDLNFNSEDIVQYDGMVGLEVGKGDALNSPKQAHQNENLHLMQQYQKSYEYSPFFNPDILNENKQNLKRQQTDNYTSDDVNTHYKQHVDQSQNGQVQNSGSVDKRLNFNSLKGSSQNQSNTSGLLGRKRRERCNFEKEQLLAIAVPGYIDYVYNY